MAPETADEDLFTELVDAHIPRVDLVDKAANGMSFLIAKGAQGLLDADFVRELIAKSAPEHEQEVVTMSGSPAAIAKLIHEAGHPAATPEPAAPVAKDAELDESADGTDITVPLAAPDGDTPGDPADPGSPAWEAVDAATARKWTSIAVRLRNALSVMAERELLEAASADPDDAMAAWDLQDAQCALDYVIDTLAGFAVEEQSEADLGGEALAAVGKAMAGFDPAPLDTFEALAPVAKAGRVLSTANESAIRGAVEELQKVLASLPQAPTTTEDGQPVAKQESPMPETAPAAPAPDPTEIAPDAAVTKADPEKVPMVAMYDAHGKLVGIVDPADVVTIAQAEPEPEAEPDTEAPASPEAPDLAPVPAGEVGTPAGAVPEEDVAKQQADTTHDVLKSYAEDAATAALTAYSATQEQVVAKQATDLAQLAKAVEDLTELVKALEEQPAMPKVLTNGAVPPSNMLRGQNHGAAAIDVTKAQELKKSLRDSTDAREQRDIAVAMQEQARLVFDRIQPGS